MRKNQCTAHAKSGARCRKSAILGATVCGTHGGSAPQVKRAAKVRLAMAADWLIAELLTIAKSGADERTRLSAVNSALDRVGISAKAEVEVSMPGYERLLQNLVLTRTQRPLPDDDSSAGGTDVVDAEVVEPDAAIEPQPERGPDGSTKPGPNADVVSFEDLVEGRIRRQQNLTKSRAAENRPTDWR